MSDVSESRLPAGLRDGRYVVVGVLGSGAQGKTLDAVDKREGRPVAIKRFDVSGAKSWKDVELAEREARVLASLSHPMLPKYVEHFEEDGILYLVMEKIEGTPLSVLRKKGPLPEADVVRLLSDAREMLRYLHGRAPPVIHRDLKPANVIRRPNGSFAFVDFGAVRDRMRPEGGSTVVGTFGYMAPEQFQGRAGPGSDVYAIGATALSLLTGREPEDLPHKGLSFDLDQALGGRVDPGLRDAIAAMVEPDPDRRVAVIPSVERAAPRRGSAKAEPKPRGREARRAEREARREERDARRALRRRRSRGPMPWPIHLLVTLALVLARVAVVVVVRVFVPLLLTMMSLVFGPKLREAARRVADAGTRASNAMGRAFERVEAEEELAATDVRVRVDDDERIRVDQRATQEEEEAEDEEADERPKQRRQR